MCGSVIHTIDFRPLMPCNTVFAMAPTDLFDVAANSSVS